MNTTSKASLVLISALGLSAAGCGAFSTKDKGAKAQQNDINLMGEWKDACSTLDFLGFSHQSQQLNFSAVGDYDKTLTVYNESSCTTALVSVTEHGTIATLGPSATATSAQDINFTIDSASVKPLTDDAAKALNAGSYCGVTNWANGQSTDVTDKTCLGVDYAKGSTVFDVYRLDNNNKTLTLGKSSLLLDKSAANSRPSALNAADPFAKQ